MKPVYLPPMKQYSLDVLKETNLAAWEGIQRLLDSLQQELFGAEDGQNLVCDLRQLMDGGFIYPEFRTHPDTGEMQIRFLMWPYLSRQYKFIEDMEDDEFDVVTGMLEYFARVN